MEKDKRELKRDKIRETHQVELLGVTPFNLLVNELVFSSLKDDDTRLTIQDIQNLKKSLPKDLRRRIERDDVSIAELSKIILELRYTRFTNSY